MGLFGFSLPSAPVIAAAGRLAASGNSGLLPEPITRQQDAQQGGLLGFLRQSQQPGGFFERLNTFGATLQDVNDGGNRAAMLQTRALAQAQAQRQAQAREALNAALRGTSAQNTGQQSPGAPAVNSGQGALPSLRSVAPALMAAAGAGIDVGDYVNILDKSQLNLANNGQFTYDPADPNNANRFFPDIPEGAQPVYDAQQNVIGTRALDGSIQYLGQRTRAESDARNASQASYAGAISGAQAAAQAPYQIETVTGPDGAPIVTSRANLLAQGGITGQTPAQAVVAEGNARNQVAALEDARNRASAANRILPQLDNMERLLGDINSGFGANVRTGADRLMASLPLGSLNDDAQRRASATQTFQGEARQVVSGILPLFGANPTEGERKYAEQMSGADVTYTPEAIQEGIRLARARAQREQQRYEQMQAGVTGGQAAPRSAPSAPPSREALLAEARRRGLVR